jgi:hypothetical protein
VRAGCRMHIFSFLFFLTKIFKIVKAKKARPHVRIGNLKKFSHADPHMRIPHHIAQHWSWLCRSFSIVKIIRSV